MATKTPTAPLTLPSTNVYTILAGLEAAQQAITGTSNTPDLLQQGWIELANLIAPYLTPPTSSPTFTSPTIRNKMVNPLDNTAPSNMMPTGGSGGTPTAGSPSTPSAPSGGGGSIPTGDTPTQGLTVKGVQATPAQQAYANRIIQIGHSLKASKPAIASVIAEAIAESGLGEAMGWDNQNPTYGGLLAGSTSNFGSLGASTSKAVTDAEIRAAFQGGKGYQGGAIALAANQPNLLQVAMTNSGSGTQFLQEIGHSAFVPEAYAFLANHSKRTASGAAPLPASAQPNFLTVSPTSAPKTTAQPNFLSQTPPQTSSGDINPLQHFPVLGRTDQGVDAKNVPAGTPILAPNNSKAIGISPNWYLGQPYALYQLTAGPNKGKYYYVAEQIQNIPAPGTYIQKGKPIATYAPSGTGIEIGWGSPTPGQTLAQATTGYSEGQVTPAGTDFLQNVIQGGSNKNLPSVTLPKVSPSQASFLKTLGSMEGPLMATLSPPSSTQSFQNTLASMENPLLGSITPVPGINGEVTKLISGIAFMSSQLANAAAAASRQPTVTIPKAFLGAPPPNQPSTPTQSGPAGPAGLTGPPPPTVHAPPPPSGPAGPAGLTGAPVASPIIKRPTSGTPMGGFR